MSLSKTAVSVQKSTLKQRFLRAIIKGELGTVEDRGVIVTLKEFKAYFSDIKTQYICSFLPAATIETGQHSMSTPDLCFELAKGFIWCIRMRWLNLSSLNNALFWGGASYGCINVMHPRTSLC